MSASTIKYPTNGTDVVSSSVGTRVKEQEVIRRLRREGTVVPTTRKADSGTLLKVVLERYIDEYLFLKGISSSTVLSYKRAVNSFIRSNGNLPINQINIKHIVKWKKDLKSLESSTVSGYICNFRNFLKWCVRKDLTRIDTEDIFVPKTVQKLVTFLTPEEVLVLIDLIPKSKHEWVNLRNIAIIATLYTSGVRSKELRSLKKTDFQGYQFKVMGKGSKERICFIDDWALKHINKYLEACPYDSEYLFCTANDSMMTSENIGIFFRKASKKLGKKITPHTLRHSFATNLHNNGCDIRDIQEFLGHANIRTTQVYTHVSTTRLQQIHSKLHTVPNSKNTAFINHLIKEQRLSQVPPFLS